MRDIHNLRILIIGVLCVAAVPTSGKSDQVVYVDDDAQISGDGSSWARAYPFLQDALTTAKSLQEPVEIRVAQGVYRPNQGLLPLVPSSTGIGGRGGPYSYPGEWPADQDREATFELVSGVIMKGGYAGASAPDPNARDVERYETILSGDLNGDDIVVSDPCDLPNELTRADNSYTVVTASGIDATAVLDGITIIAGQHDGEWGGAGMRISSGNPMVIDCRFLSNWASSGGGGVMNVASSPIFVRCTFASNCSQSGGGISNMPAVYTGRDSNPTFANCVFMDNYATFYGGALLSGGGNCELRNCTFYRNQTDGGSGGAVYVVGTEVSIMSCTFFGNIAPHARACYTGEDATLSITNTVLWDDGEEIGVGQSALVRMAYSNIQGGWPGQGNISVDFVCGPWLPRYEWNAGRSER